MSNILDYIAWRGDMPFTAAPFNEVDNLILSRLSYLPLDGIIADFCEKCAGQRRNSTGSRSLTAAAIHDTNRRSLPAYRQAPPADALTLAELYIRKRNDAAWMSGMLDPANDPLLLERAAASERFGRIRLCFSRNIFDKSIAEQFYAVTAILDDGTAYISFRGTDNTIVGWKEDFNMSFMTHIPSQLDALKYLETAAAALPDVKAIRIGGHSKGGNLAIYAALKCRPEIKNRITAIYNNDGPGFSEGFAELYSSDEILSRIHTYVPQTSIIGMLLNHPEDYSVIESSQIGFLQHDVYSWNVLGPAFIHRAEITEGSQLADRTITEWLSGLSCAQRSVFTDTLFGVLESCEVETFRDIAENPKAKMMFMIIKQLCNLDKESRSNALKILKSFFGIAGRNLTAELGSYISPK